MENDSADSLNSELSAVWDRFLAKDPSDLHPVYFRKMRKSPITFVGMNPSFNQKGLMKVLKGTEYDKLNVDEYFRLSNENFNIIESNEIDELSKKKYLKFFKQHQILSDRLGVKDWNHLDLFQYRQTNQKEFKAKILNRDGNLNEFGEAQFNLFFKALRLANPKVIILANATAGKIVKTNLDIRFSEKSGTYMLKVGSKSIPLFLSGMLTGGRALDVFSRERLFWHVQRVYSNTF